MHTHIQIALNLCDWYEIVALLMHLIIVCFCTQPFVQPRGTIFNVIACQRFDNYRVGMGTANTEVFV